MKFRDPKTGKVFEDIEDARISYCAERECVDCVIFKKSFGNTCPSWVKHHPVVAACLMGFEVVDDHVGDTTKKVPRMCRVLGVEVGERFSIDGYPTDYGLVQVCEDGKIRRVISTQEFPFAEDGEMGHKIGANALYYLLNHPDRIIRKPRWTEEEVADAKAVQRIFRATVVGRLENSRVYTANRAMSLNEVWSDNDRITYLPQRIFQSLLPGQSVSLADITHPT